jgi:hypothetical protein
MRHRAVLVLLALLVLTLTASTAALASERGVSRDVLPSVRGTVDSHGWVRALQVVSNLRARPPKAPLVLILGNSMAREATVSDTTLAVAIERRCGRRVMVRNIASSNQAFGKDAALVPYLPSRRTIVFIGVDLVRFSQELLRVRVKLPAPGPLPGYAQHRYSSANICDLSLKQRLVSVWMTDVYPDFTRRFDDNLALLESIIVACKKRGLRPVLFTTPWNTAVVREGWDAPVTAIRDGCSALATRYEIPFVDLVDRAKFASTDFYDLLHAVEPGRAKFQRLLAAETGRLVTRWFPTN